MSATILPILDVPDYEEQIQRAGQLITGGDLVILPTETVYGAAGLVNHPQALAKLRSLRGASTTPFTIHLPTPAQASQFLGEVSEFGQRLMRKLWPGPIGLMFEVPAERCAQVAGQLGLDAANIYQQDSITLRCPDHPVAADVLNLVNGPVVLTAGAGAWGPVHRVTELTAGVLEQVQLVLDAGPSRFSKPSTLLRVKPQGYEIVRSGVYDERIIERLLQTTILFVCSGNTCRSPMAEALARQSLARKLGVSEADLDKKRINVISAGSFAMPGARAAQPAVSVMKAMGTDLTRHRSQPMSIELIHQADAIFGMSQGHVRAITALAPWAADKVMRLDPDGDIEDPIGGDEALYRQLAQKLQGLIDKRLAERNWI